MACPVLKLLVDERYVIFSFSFFWFFFPFNHLLGCVTKSATVTRDRNWPMV